MGDNMLKLIISPISPSSIPPLVEPMPGMVMRNGRGEIVKFGNINAHVNHEVVPFFHKF